jgi:hypothetical protein
MEESTTARLLRQIREACELVGAKTEEYARISRKRLDVLSISREIHKEKTALGERVYDLLREKTPSPVGEDSTVLAILDRLRTLDSSLADCEEEITGIREQARHRVADVRRKYEGPAGTAGPAPDPASPGQEAQSGPPPPADRTSPGGDAPPAETPSGASKRVPSENSSRAKPSS